jgi:hypothetical protein
MCDDKIQCKTTHILQWTFSVISQWLTPNCNVVDPDLVGSGAFLLGHIRIQIRDQFDRLKSFTVKSLVTVKCSKHNQNA